MTDIDAADEWLESWAASVDADAFRAVELARRVAALTGTAHSRDGLLTVTVGPDGRLTRLDLDDRATRQRSGTELSREIMALVRRAQAELPAQVAAQVDRTVGAGTETGRAVLHSYAERFPPQPAEPPADRPATAGQADPGPCAGRPATRRPVTDWGDESRGW